MSLFYRTVSSSVKLLAKVYTTLKRPIVITVAGSVGKTSTKLMLAHMLKSKRVSFMDDSYNNGLGLYLSVFEVKVPSNLKSISGWIKVFIKIIARFFKRSPEILILEYGIDHPGDMDKMVSFIKPDVAMLTAVTPEHMEFMKTLDGVAEEETKVLTAAKMFSVYNHNEIKQSYVPKTSTPIHAYGSDNTLSAHYKIVSWQKSGAEVSFTIRDDELNNLAVQFISEPLIRQLTGATLIASLLGVPANEVKKQLSSATPAASRMRLFDGVNGSTIIDDTTNFSPDAGVESLIALKRLPANRHIAVLGNMHELGEYADKGYQDVAKEFVDIDILALVGDLSTSKFGELARSMGFVDNKTLLFYENSVEAGLAMRDLVSKDDAVLVKGPFGGYYLEETVRLLLKDKSDIRHLTRQSEFWQKKKQGLFGKDYSI